MREKQNCVVVTFYTTAEAMATKKLCSQNRIKGRLIPAPRSLSADCGIAWKSEISYSDRLKEALNDAEIEYAGIHEIMI